MNIKAIKNNVVRRIVLVLILPVGAVVGLGVVLWAAGIEYAKILTTTPEEFRRVWRGE